MMRSQHEQSVTSEYEVGVCFVETFSGSMIILNQFWLLILVTEFSFPIIIFKFAEFTNLIAIPLAT